MKQVWSTRVVVVVGLLRTILAGVLFCPVLFDVVAVRASAEPVTYTGFTITDGKLDSWTFHNARVYLTFKGDTRDVQFIQPPIDPSQPSGPTVDVWIIETGRASATIISGDRIVKATFAPNQIFVSLDLGDTSEAPQSGGRGVGFGSITATGIEPVYPLGIEDGTIDWGDILNNSDAMPSPELTLLSTDLVHSTGFSGRAWSCVGFPGPCAAPNALHTDKGDLYLYSPYALSPSFGFDTLNGGFFIADVSDSNAPVTVPLPPIAAPIAASAHPITYYGYVISDVTFGGTYYSGAQVYLSFDADPSTVVPFSTGNGFTNVTGKAHVSIVSGSKIVSADFDPGQLFVYYDIDHASVGFGSNGNERGYPLSITANSDVHGLVENSLIGAVSDLTLTPANASKYTPTTASLQTDLKHATLLSGAASSCVGFDPVASACASLTPVPLRTNRGDFYLFEPYRQDAIDPATATTFSVNWGVFWAETRPTPNK